MSSVSNPPKAVPSTKVLVPYRGQMVLLAELVSLLEAFKPTFSENHELVAELRDAIEQGHKLRSDNTDLDLLVVQTERNIAAKERIIDKAHTKMA